LISGERPYFTAPANLDKNAVIVRTRKLHNWDLSYSEAIALQKRYSREVRLVPVEDRIETIAGIDCALSKDKQQIIAATVVFKPPWTQKGLGSGGSGTTAKGRTITVTSASRHRVTPSIGAGFELIETAAASRKLTFPYIPGLLSFREAPVCIEAVEKLKTEPDVFIIDGQGIAHPRRFGLAAHLGLFFDKPTIGCAKSRLTGMFEEPPPEKGGHTLLKHKDEIIGAVLRTRTNVKPVFVSVGNKCLLEDAIRITLACTTKYRLPEPTRRAHQLVSKLRLKVKCTQEPP
jgi:deoxyribonuclease V